MENKEIQNYKNFENFFISNLRIKKIIREISPFGANFYDEQSRMEYIERYLDALKEIDYQISRILDSFDFDPEVKFSINKKLKQCESKIIDCNYDRQRIETIHQEFLSYMDENLISQVKETCVGYTLFNLPYQLFESCKTINEFLHVIHAYIINSEAELHSMPVLSKKANAQGYTITLYGKENNGLAQQIFEQIPEEMDIGDTDIVSLSECNKIIMMVRDKGHALSLEISQEDDEIWIDYFIPKLCNKSMIKKLKGLIDIDEKSNTAVGLIRTNLVDASKEIVDFIEAVPDDRHIVLEEFIEYNLSKQESEEKTSRDEIISEVFKEESVQKLTDERKIGRIKLTLDAFKRTILGIRKKKDGDDELTND